MKKYIFLQLALIIFLSLIVFYPSFHLGLFGDDWLAFWRYNHHLGPGSSGEYNHLTYYLTPYGAQDIIMGLLRKVYGFHSSFYYLTSYILRLLAAFSLFPLVLYITKNKLAAFFASLFFSVTVIGLDATNWVFNMPSYATIALFNISLYFFIKHRDKPVYKLLILSGVFYYFAYITTPIRMHGSLIFLFLLEVCWVLQNRDSKTLKRALVRFGTILFVFIIIRYTGHSMGPSNEISERFNLGLKADLTMLGQGRFDFLFYPVLMFGSMIIPDLLSPHFQINSTRSLLPLTIITLLGFSLFLFLLARHIEKLKSNYGKIISLSLFWTFLSLLVYKFNASSLPASNLFLSLLVGGYTIILAIFLLSTSVFLGLSWSILSFFFAWWWVPASIFPTTYRYLIVSAAGVVILLSSIIAFGKNKSHQLTLFFLISPLLLINIWANRLFINQSLASHSQDISNKIWQSIPEIADISSKNGPLIFYFEGDGTNGAILHDVITFGFPPHMALIYNLKEGDPIPVPMSDFKEVVSAVTDGKTMPAYGYKAEPVAIGKIYAFYLTGQDNLIDITAIVRGKLVSHP